MASRARPGRPRSIPRRWFADPIVAAVPKPAQVVVKIIINQVGPAADALGIHSKTLRP